VTGAGDRDDLSVKPDDHSAALLAVRAVDYRTIEKPRKPDQRDVVNSASQLRRPDSRQSSIMLDLRNWWTRNSPPTSNSSMIATPTRLAVCRSAVFWSDPSPSQW
jgi:hypothetical protein